MEDNQIHLESEIGTTLICSSRAVHVLPCCEKNTLPCSFFIEPPKVMLLSCGIMPKALAVHSCCHPQFGLKQGL